LGEPAVRAERGGAIARRALDFHQPSKGDLIVRSQRACATRREQCAVEISARATTLRTRNRGAEYGIVQPAPLRVEPPLEFRRIGDVKALEQLAGVTGESLRQPARGEVRLERHRVARNPIAIHPDLFVPSSHNDFAQCLSDSVQGIAQRVAPACLVGLRPEERH
jgi:hypothetical protein